MGGVTSKGLKLFEATPTTLRLHGFTIMVTHRQQSIGKDTAVKSIAENTVVCKHLWPQGRSSTPSKLCRSFSY